MMRKLARLFGYESSDRYMKNIWKVTVGCMCTVITIFSLMFLYVFVDEIILDEWYMVARRYACIGIPSEERHLSNHILFQKYGSKTRIVNEVTGEVTMKNVMNVVTSVDKSDTLAVFFKDDKRGYLNRNTGKVVIPAKYSNAWIFSEGLAAVVEDGELKCLYTKDLKVVLPLEYSDIYVRPHVKTILARKGMEAPKLYDFDMNIISDFVVDHVSHMNYYTGEERETFDDDGNQIFIKEFKVANSKLYRVGTPGSRDTYGLMSKQGKILTPPIYDDITAVGPDRYLCSPHGVVLDDSGREV